LKGWKERRSDFWVAKSLDGCREQANRCCPHRLVPKTSFSPGIMAVLLLDLKKLTEAFAAAWDKQFHLDQ
jgi:hypothetical protein